MERAIEAVYENGVLRPRVPLSHLQEGQPVYVWVREIVTDPDEIKRREAELFRRLEAEGTLIRFPAPATRPPPDFEPLVIKGEPLSETIIKERR
jgi:predicted DNA-binding antitoxin AbrB/MazE fold protein